MIVQMCLAAVYAAFVSAVLLILAAVGVSSMTGGEIAYSIAFAFVGSLWGQRVAE